MKGGIKMNKRIIAFFLSVVLIVSGLSAVSAAAVKREWSPTISVDDFTVTANETVLVNINLSDNTYGIMAFTISLIYDKSVLTYVGRHKGLFRYGPPYVVEKDGYIAIVDCEDNNIKENGIMITLEFTVNADAPGGTYPLKIGHVRPKTNGEDLTDCFANKRGDIITPKVKNGSVTIPLTQENCRHNYSEWKERVEATCVNEGIDSRSCVACGKSETRTTEKTDHIYEKEWTVDVPATKESEGVMSRHCRSCSKKTDYIYFPYESQGGSDFNNEKGDTATKEDKVVSDNYKPETSTTAPPEVEETVSTTVEPTEETEQEQTEQKETEEIDANTLVTEKLKDVSAPKGIAGKIYSFFFGTDGEGGIVNAIIKAFKEFIKNLF